MTSVKKMSTTSNLSANPKIASVTGSKKPLISKTGSTVMKKPLLSASKKMENETKIIEKTTTIESVKSVAARTSATKPSTNSSHITTIKKPLAVSSSVKSTTKPLTVKSVADSTTKSTVKPATKTPIRISSSVVKPISATNSTPTKPISKVTTSPNSDTTFKKSTVVKSAAIQSINRSSPKSPKSPTIEKSAITKAKPNTTISKVSTLKSSVIPPSPTKTKSSTITNISKIKPELATSKTSSTTKLAPKLVTSLKTSAKSSVVTKLSSKSSTPVKSVVSKAGSVTPKSIRTRPPIVTSDVVKRLQDENEIEIRDADSTTIEEKEDDYAENSNSIKLCTCEDNFKEESNVDEQRVYAVAEQLICLMKPEQLQVITGDDAAQQPAANDTYVIDMNEVEANESISSMTEVSKELPNDEMNDVSVIEMNLITPSKIEEGSVVQEESNDEKIAVENLTEKLSSPVETSESESYETKVQETTNIFCCSNDILDETTEEKMKEETKLMYQNEEIHSSLDDCENRNISDDELLNNQNCAETATENISETTLNIEESITELTEEKTVVLYSEEAVEVNGTIEPVEEKVPCEAQGIPEVFSESVTVSESENSLLSTETSEDSVQEPPKIIESIADDTRIKNLTETVSKFIEDIVETSVSEINLEKVENLCDSEIVPEVDEQHEVGQSDEQMKYQVENSSFEVYNEDLMKNAEEFSEPEFSNISIQSENNVVSLYENLSETWNIENLNGKKSDLINYESGEVVDVDIESYEQKPLLYSETSFSVQSESSVFLESESEVCDKQNIEGFIIDEQKNHSTDINCDLPDDVSILSNESMSYAEVLRSSKSSDQISNSDSLDITEDMNLMDEFQHQNGCQSFASTEEPSSDSPPEVAIDTAVCASPIIYSLYDSTEFPDTSPHDEHYEKQDHDQHEVDQHDETFHKIRHKRNKRRNKKNRKCNSENLEEQAEKNTNDNPTYQGEYHGRRRNSRRWRNSRGYYEAFHQYQQTHQEYYADPHWKFTKMD